MKKYGINLRKRIPGQAGAEARNCAGQAMQNTGFTIGSPVTSGILVTPATAMNFVSVFSAVNGIATDMATLGLRTMRCEDNDSAIAGPGDLRQPALRQQPRPGSRVERFPRGQAILGHTLLWGNGYLEILRNGRGQPIELYPLNPGRTQPRRDDWTGKLAITC